MVASETVQESTCLKLAKAEVNQIVIYTQMFNDIPSNKHLIKAI